MLFGDPTNFAVEIYCDATEPRWLGFGRMCVFVGGMRLGNLEEQHCSLFHAVERLAEVARSLTELRDHDFSSSEPEAVFSYLDRALYVGEAIPGKELHRFDFLTNTGEPFDHEKSFIYATSQGTLCVVAQRRDGSLASAVCSSSAFEQATAELVLWFNNHVRRTRVQ